MSILDFFKKKNKTSNNNADEVFISSDKPYIVAEGCTDDLQSFRTYTERLKFQGLLKLELSCKVFYEEENGWVIEFFLPAPDIIEKVQEIRRNPKPCMFSVWIWFEDGTFDINFPSCCDLDVYAKEGIIWCPITLSETGFDSEEKKLKEKYPTPSHRADGARWPMPCEKDTDEGTSEQIPGRILAANFVSVFAPKS